ncbi:acyltransferase [Lewinella sp. IMCC34183]|uniref:acyltransferase n=1 Tax=Lewinella sp. IMCC34183 TaxID=2248762 RepID=UPI000E2655B7|nr:acyltransferase [Lewinella sp. IMCC34183]
MEPPFVHPTAVVDPGARLGAGSKVWHFCHLMADCEVGPGCSLGQNVFVAGGVRLGKGCKVQNNVSLFTGVELGDDVFVGPSAVFTNVKNPRASVNRRGEYLPTRVGNGATIGANATVVCGVTLHAFAFVGAGAVVTRDVPAYALVTGNPARQTGWRSEAGHALSFDPAGRARCPETGPYLLEDGVVRRA